jgi:hypothetical protein
MEKCSEEETQRIGKIYKNLGIFGTEGVGKKKDRIDKNYH